MMLDYQAIFIQIIVCIIVTKHEQQNMKETINISQPY